MFDTVDEAVKAARGPDGTCNGVQYSGTRGTPTLPCGNNTCSACLWANHAKMCPSCSNFVHSATKTCPTPGCGQHFDRRARKKVEATKSVKVQLRACIEQVRRAEPTTRAERSLMSAPRTF
jgi:hypothetical protein